MEQMKRSVTIEIGYPGSIISVNHYKYCGGFYTKPEAKAFMDELGWKAKVSLREGIGRTYQFYKRQ